MNMPYQSNSRSYPYFLVKTFTRSYLFPKNTALLGTLTGLRRPRRGVQRWRHSSSPLRIASSTLGRLGRWEERERLQRQIPW